MDWAGDGEIANGVKDQASDGVQQVSGTFWGNAKYGFESRAREPNRSEFGITKQWREPFSERIKCDGGKSPGN